MGHVKDYTFRNIHYVSMLPPSLHNQLIDRTNAFRMQQEIRKHLNKISSYDDETALSLSEKLIKDLMGLNPKNLI